MNIRDIRTEQFAVRASAYRHTHTHTPQFWSHGISRRQFGRLAANTVAIGAALGRRCVPTRCESGPPGAAGNTVEQNRLSLAKKGRWVYAVSWNRRAKTEIPDKGGQTHNFQEFFSFSPLPQGQPAL